MMTTADMAMKMGLIYNQLTNDFREPARPRHDVEGDL